MTAKTKASGEGPSAKSAKERKADFDDRHLNRGAKDPSKPERWAVMVYLTDQAKLNLAAMRRNNRILKTGPTTNSEIVEAWLLSDSTEGAKAFGDLEASHARIRKRRSVQLQSAEQILTRLETGFDATAAREAVFEDHVDARDRWSVNLARSVRTRIDAGEALEDLRWFFREVLDDYVDALLSGTIDEMDGFFSETDMEVLEWVRRRLGITPVR